MKTIIALFMVLLAVSVVADELPAQESSDAGSNALSFISGLNPIILIVAGIILFFASHLAKFIAIILIIVGILSLLLSVI